MADPKKSKKELADELLLQRQKVAELDKEFALLQKISKEWETLAKKKEGLGSNFHCCWNIKFCVCI
jgi:hypothetical protein